MLIDSVVGPKITTPLPDSFCKLLTIGQPLFGVVYIEVLDDPYII